MSLVGWSADKKDLLPGGSVRISLFWRCERPMEQNWEVAVHLLDASNGMSYAESENHPGNGLRPTASWVYGETIQDDHLLQLSPATPNQIVLHVAVSVFRREAGHLIYLTKTGPFDRGDTVSIGSLAVRGAAAAPPVDMGRVGLQLGDDFRLDGLYPERRVVRPGQKIEVILDWVSLAETRTSYKVFVHLLDSKSRVIAQDDAEPRRNGYPTNVWRPGEHIFDSHVVAVPTSFTGVARLEVGMYDAGNLQRLRFEDGSSSMVGGTVSVQGRPDVQREPHLAIPGIVMHPSPAHAGSVVTVAWTDLPNPRPQDTIELDRLHPVTGQVVEQLGWIYLTCSHVPSEAVKSSGVCPFWLPDRPGRFRLVLKSSGQVFETPEVAVEVGGPVIQVATTEAMVNTVVQVHWERIEHPTVGDWIGLYRLGDPDAPRQYWLYTSSCGHIVGEGQAGGSCDMPLPPIPGVYEFRLFVAGRPQPVAVSNSLYVRSLSGADGGR